MVAAPMTYHPHGSGAGTGPALHQVYAAPPPTVPGGVPRGSVIGAVPGAPAGSIVLGGPGTSVVSTGPGGVPSTTVVSGGPTGVAYGGAVPIARKGTITDALFTQLDVNNDGVISRSEFRRGLK